MNADRVVWWFSATGLIALLAGCTLAFGGTSLSVQFVAMTATIAIVAASAVSRFRTQHDCRLSFPAVTLFGLIAMGMIQITPIPTHWVSSLSPMSNRLQELFVADPGTSSSDLAVVSTATISVYPASTRLELWQLTAAVAVVIVSSQLFRTAAAIRMVVGAFAVFGAALSYLGMAFRMTSPGTLLNLVDAPGSCFGPFANANNAAGFLCIMLVAAVAWTALIWKPADDFDAAEVQDDSGAESQSFRLLTLRCVAVICVVTIIGGIAACGSRGGLIASLSVGIAYTVAQTARGKVGQLMAVVLGFMIVGVMVAIFAGQKDMVGEAYDDLVDVDSLASDGRVGLWQDALAVYRQFPGFGSGLGTFEYVRPVIVSSVGQVNFVHAENALLESMAVAGSVGMLWLVAGFAAACYASVRQMRLAIASDDADAGDADAVEAESECQSDSKVLWVQGVMGFALVISQMLSNMFDFGLFIFSNLIAFSMLMGIAFSHLSDSSNGVGVADVDRDFNRKGVLQQLQERWPFELLSIATLALLLIGVFDMHAASGIQGAHRGIMVEGLGKSKSDEIELDRLVSGLGRRWDDAEGHLQLASWQVSEFYRRTETDPTLRQIRDVPLIELPAFLRRLESRDATKLVNVIQSNQEVGELLKPAYQHLLLARQSCGLLKDVHLGLAQLQFIASPQSDPQLLIMHLSRWKALAGDATYLDIAGETTTRDEKTKGRSELSIRDQGFDAALMLSNSM
ncbi:O-antigen ligase family protein [Rubripirellula reticaptiva]|uniref:O-Antigen ligase n=1 Tax=Rubripirellula reticaptiva TaxID=2528013 RepID=A0A5C6EIX8_9BACT|nr:O-antigen ligase family protein [Rubripirellula reticaptiva]TWU48430.1 O-Antigen ligase [Rubripirellula reticaptiva]